VRAEGVEVLLCGGRAEAVILPESMEPLHLADLLGGLRLGRFARELWRWQRGTHRPLANLMLSCVFRPLLGRRRYRRSPSEERLDPCIAGSWSGRARSGIPSCTGCSSSWRWRGTGGRSRWRAPLTTPNARA
jgi:hypothetical protein